VNLGVGQTNMIIPRIDGYYSSDCDPIEKWVPDNKYDVNIFIDVYIGYVGLNQKSGEYFTINIVTKNNVDSADVKHIVVDAYEWELVKKMIEEIIKNESGNNWHELANKINKFFNWEFDNYKEFAQQGDAPEPASPAR
jgi:dihydroneopterin aldolase